MNNKIIVSILCLFVCSFASSPSAEALNVCRKVLGASVFGTNWKTEEQHLSSPRFDGFVRDLKADPLIIEAEEVDRGADRNSPALNPNEFYTRLRRPKEGVAVTSVEAKLIRLSTSRRLIIQNRLAYAQLYDLDVQFNLGPRSNVTENVSLSFDRKRVTEYRQVRDRVISFERTVRYTGLVTLSDGTRGQMVALVHQYRGMMTRRWLNYDIQLKWHEI